MSRTLFVFVGSLLVSASFLSGCARQEAAFEEAPPAPTMPASWKITSDRSFSPADIRPVADKLRGEVTALRNTVYDVDGKPVKLNTIVTGSTADADRIMVSLRAMKPDEFLLRRGAVIYEFVGANDAIPDMLAGKSHIETTHARAG